MSFQALESLRGSRNRGLVLGVVNRFGPLRLQHIADRAGLQPVIAEWTLHGHPPAYAFELALVRLDLVRVRYDAFGALYEVTPTGKAACEALSPVMQRG